MSLLSRIVAATASVLCSHEWASRCEPNRWYLECIKCGTTTAGIEVGRTGAAPAGVRHAHASRLLKILEPTSSRAA